MTSPTFSPGSMYLSCPDRHCQREYLACYRTLMSLSVRHIHIRQQRPLLRHRRLARGRDGAVDKRGDLTVHGIQSIRFEQHRLGHPAAEIGDAVALLAQPLDFILAAIELCVA